MHLSDTSSDCLLTMFERLSIRIAASCVVDTSTCSRPVTKSAAIEMLTLVDLPLILYVIDEAPGARIEEFISVYVAGKSALEDYFDTAATLEHRLTQSGKPEVALTIQR
ncbi:utp--glucose-1-phosphate uridylyltransferase [Thalassobium sp. R2A62]|nr:utp--glucose-1-phosphate uridylyltransferase [Thalassobium sp. R2A62]